MRKETKFLAFSIIFCMLPLLSSPAKSATYSTYHQTIVFPDGLTLDIEVGGQIGALANGNFYEYRIYVEVVATGSTVYCLIEFLVNLWYDDSPVSYVLTNPLDGFFEGDSFELYIFIEFLEMFDSSINLQMDFYGFIDEFTREFYQTDGITMGDVYKDFDDPTISSMGDLEFEEGDCPWITIAWDINDDNPDYYEVYFDGSKVLEDSFTGFTTVSYEIAGGLPFGIYSSEIIVVDLNENTNSDQLIITITDSVHPNIVPPSDIEYLYGDTGNTITWAVNDNNPGNYSVYIDDIEVLINETWIPPAVIFNVDGLEVGSHNVTLALQDEAGNLSTDTVIVTVIEIIPELDITFFPLLIPVIIFTTGYIKKLSSRYSKKKR